jgi:hypothetical protein
MDKHDLRAIILRIEDRLSEDDRTRLHFFLRDDVPRRYIDDLSLGGTLNLIDSLISQDLINENNFNLLIDAFNTIRCFDAVKLLKGTSLFEYISISFYSIHLEHTNRMQSSVMDQSLQSLSSIMPPVTDHFRVNQSDGIDSSESRK